MLRHIVDINIKSQKMESSEDFFCIELKLCTVVTKFYYMSIVTFPWQQNGFQALFIQKVKSEKKKVFFFWLHSEKNFTFWRNHF